VITAFDERDRARLIGCLNLLGSSQSGEVLAAAAAAGRILERHNLRWADLVCPPDPKPSPKPQPPPRQPLWKNTVAQCLKRTDALSEWERKFLENIKMFTRLSSKQREALDRIAGKAGV